MGFWSTIKNIGYRTVSGAKRLVGAGYSVFKRVVGYSRVALDKVEALRNIPQIGEIASSIAELNPELALTVAGGILAAEGVIKSAERTISAIDAATDAVQT